MGNVKYAHLLKTIAVTGGAFLLNYLIQLFLTPYITEHVGADAYGFVTLAKNFAQYAAIVTAALNSFASRYIAVQYHKNDLKAANVYFSSAFLGDVVLGSFLFGVAFIMIGVLDRLIVIPEALVGDVKVLFLLVFLNFLIVTVSAAFESGAYVKDKLNVSGVVKGLSYAAEACTLCILYLVFPDRVLYVGIGLMVASLVTFVGNIWICRKYTPELKVKRRDFSTAAVKDLVGGGAWTSLGALGEVLNNGLDLLVCNLMLSPLQMGQVAFAKTVHAMLHGLFVIINPAFQPMFLRSYVQKDRGILLNEMNLAMKVSGFLGSVAFAGIAALGLDFFKLWIPGEDIRVIHELTVINCLTFIPGGPMQPLYYIYTLTVKKKIPSFITIAGGMLNVAGMYLLIRYTKLGVYSVMWTTAAVMMVINFLTNPLYMAHVLSLPKRTFYPTIGRNVLSCGAMTLAFMGLRKLYAPGNYLTLALCAVGYVIVGAVIHLLIVCGRDERRLILKHLKRTKNA